MRFVDLSHVVTDGLVTHPGFPAPVIGEYLSRADSAGRYAPGTSFQIGRIDMIACTGTYLDAPSHRFEDAPDLAALELEQLANLEGVVVDGPDGERAIGAACLPEQDLAGRAVLFRTGWSRHFATPRYAERHPYLKSDAATALVERRVALVGIDSLNVDDTKDGARPAHSALLGAGIPVVEHLTNLAALGKGPFRFFAVPVKVRGMGSFPVRAFALVP